MLTSINTDKVGKDWKNTFPDGWSSGSSSTGEDGSGSYGADVFYERAGMFGLGEKIFLA